MTRFTSIGIKKRAFLPSAAEESAALAQADPSHATPTTATDDAAPPPPKRLKSHRGTRGKKDKRIKAPKPVTQGSEAVEGQAAGAGGGQEVATEYVGQFDDERAPDGRKTMAGLKGPKPGETATEHQARMAKRETQKERRRKDEEARMRATEQRRLQRMDERARETTCFACREKGHSARDCPTALEGEPEIDGIRTMIGRDTVNICYRCGSAQHSLSRCPKKLDKANPMPFASCFVCLEKGHLAGRCPRNTAKGVYPEGGECKICRSKEHLAKDCGLRRDEAALGTALLPSTHEIPARSLGADEDDSHHLKRARAAVEKEERIEAGVGKPGQKGFVRPVPAGSAQPLKKRKVVAF